MECMCVYCRGAFPKQGAEGGAQRRGAGYGQQSWNWTSSGVEQPHKAGLSHGLSPAVICGCHSCSAVDSGVPPVPLPCYSSRLFYTRCMPSSSPWPPHHPQGKPPCVALWAEGCLSRWSQTTPTTHRVSVFPVPHPQPPGRPLNTLS